MCGIAGLIKYKDVLTKVGQIEKMASSIEHRGPDASGYYENDRMAFGHRRLSIIDLSACSNQPMADHSGRYQIIFNGEIYNFRDIKAKLPDYRFQTQGDAEVILAAYAKWGPSCLNQLAGMFAFAIWDNFKQELFIARDRFGVKPLYYYHLNDTFLFASEIRALLASGLVPSKINHTAISAFLQFQSVGGNVTMVEGIKSLEAGHFLKLDPHGLYIHQYWSPVQNKPGLSFDNETEVKGNIFYLLSRSVERRLVSDVPLGAFLSGGIDSSAIVGLMASVSTEKVNTFTVGFEEKEFDESGYARKIAQKFNTSHQEILLKPESFLEELLPALDAMDTPSGDGVNSYVVSKAIRNTGIIVALSGVGGDELFAGYPIFRQYLQLMRFQKLWNPLKPARKLMTALVNDHNTKSDRYRQLLGASAADIRSFYPAFRQIVSQQMLQQCTRLNAKNITPDGGALNKLYPALGELPLLSQVSVAEYSGYTQHTLLKDMDQMSMARSLEVREPFFDHDLVEYVLHVPDKIKFPAYPKKLLVESLGDLLPPEIVHRKKQGFLFPWNEWMKKELRNFCEQHLRDISGREFMKGDEILVYWKKFLKNDPSVRWMEIWLFVVLEYWLKKYDIR